MTYIEFFDRSHAENICACLSGKPERVVLVGKDRKQMEKSVENYNKVLGKRGIQTEFVIISLPMNNLGVIINCFEELVKVYDGCVFDLSGGDELYLVAAGIIYERYPERDIELVRFNLNVGKIYDCDGNGLPELTDFPSIDIEENITLYGGEVIYGEQGTHKWQVTEELIKDVEGIWDICRGDTRRWNSLISVFAAADCVSMGGLDVNVSVSLLSGYADKLVTKSDFDYELAGILEKSGFISGFGFNGSRLMLTYKNESVKRCLTKAGQALEMAVYIAALKAKGDDGALSYNDVLTGVCIDWDSSQPGVETENEIDVLAMHGMIPVFISCKNGYVDIDELYKLNTVAQRFGSGYAKKVLIASSLNKETGFGDGLADRAEAMGIRVLANETSSCTVDELAEKLKYLWK